MTTKEKIIEALKDRTSEEIIAIYNEYAEAERYERIYDMYELDGLEGSKPLSEVLDRLGEDFNIRHNYFTYTDDLDILSFDYYDDTNSPVYLDELAEWIIDEDKAGEYIDDLEN